MANENKNALKNALDRLAAAIKNKMGGEAAYPFTIEEMCQIMDGTMPAANEGEKGKEGFFYYMGKMADCIAERCSVELPLTIEEMIEALGSVKLGVFNLVDRDSGTTLISNLQYEEGMTWNEWISSKYNTTNGMLYVLWDEIVCYDGRELHRPATDKITQQTYYVSMQDSGGVA